MRLFSLLFWLPLALWAAPALTGGGYELEAIVEEPGESWPAVIAFTLDDNGKLSGGTVTYPQESCRARIVRTALERDRLILYEKITRNEAECPPGRYLLRLAPENLLSPPKTPRFKGGFFELEGERYPLRLRRWRYRPSAEARYRIATGSGGWHDLKKSGDPEAIKAYLLAAPDSAFAPAAAKKLADLLIERGTFDTLIDYLKHFGRFPDARRVAQAAVEILKTQPDMARAAKLFAAMPSDLHPRLAEALRPAALQDPAKAVAYLRLFPNDRAVARRLRDAIEKIDDTTLLFQAAELADDPVRKTARERLGKLLVSQKSVQPLLRYLHLYCQTPQARPALSALLRTPTLLSKTAGALESKCREPILTLFKTMADPFDASTARVVKALKPTAPRLTAGMVQELARRLRSLPAARWPEAEGFWPLLSDPSLRLQPIDTRKGRLIVKDETVRLETDIAIACQKTKEEEYEATRTLTVMLIIPVGRERARFRRTEYSCRPQSPLPAKLAASLRLQAPTQVAFSQTRKIAVLSSTPNAIGETLLKEANAPGGCKAMRSACLAQCQGKNGKNGGFFVSSDKEKCESLCHRAFYECADK